MEQGSQNEPHPSVPAEERDVMNPNMPRCPNCGWQNVRYSHSKGALDMALSMFSVLPFRCRSCGTRFHRLHRKPQAGEI